MTTARARRSRAPARTSTKNLILGFASPATLEADGALTLVRGQGVYVWDERGNKYLDGLSSLWNCNIGHGRAEVATAIAAQTRTLSYASTLLGFASQPAARLATRIARMVPKGLTRVVFTSGGSEANETVIRLVRLYWRLRQRPDKIKIVALNRAYHGSSNGAASLTGLPYFHQHYAPMLPGVAHMPRPFCYRCELGLTFPQCGLACADELERIVEREGADSIGAFIAEPVQGVGGVIVPPPGYFERIRAICDRHQILMIVDEVITGFGRTGKRFGIEHWKATPDMLVFAKGVTSGYLPLGGVVVREAIFQTLVDAGPSFSLHHGFTYSGHPVVCAAALANLDIIEREQLIPRVRKLAPHFRRRLEALRHHPIVGDVRAIGLMGAVELVQNRDTKQTFPPETNIAARVRKKAIARGVIVRASVDNVVLCPPFIITPKQLDHLFDTIDTAIAEVATEL